MAAPRLASADDQAGIAEFRSGAFAEAYRTWREAADAGDARAARFIGVMYDAGEGVPQDQGRALVWYRRAADLGDPVAMFNVAVLYDAGRGVAPDHAKAARWYARAARLHDGRAEYNLALMASSGDGIPRNPVFARRMFAAAARDGIAAAAARVHARPAVVPPDPQDATFAEAQQALLSRDAGAKSVAVSLFRRMAEGQGASASLAQYDLAWCIENGIGATQDREQAYRLYLRAAAGAADASLRQLAEAGALHLRTQVQVSTLVVPSN
ncbi:tetratricopeptide repeat protein [Lichenicola sp.]|uniref:tetratricopeptide repeat protein n=1 Tax=Lichenicola sp. TaxID=2804529 RepID=UPI003AFF7B62